MTRWLNGTMSASTHPLPLSVRLGLQTAQTIRDLLIHQGEKALDAVSHNQLTDDFQDVVDAILAGGGMVGGLGERFTRIAAAHAVHNGLTALPQTARYLHGIKVAYGLLIQLALLQKEQELNRLIPVFRRLQLPVSLSELDVSWQDKTALSALIRRTLQEGESIWYLPDVSAEKLEQAIKHVETLAAGVLVNQ